MLLIAPMNLWHLIVGARGETRLVHDDADRLAFVRALGRHVGSAALAHCLMNTHAHLVVEGELAVVRRRFEIALQVFGLGFNARHRGETLLFRGPVEAFHAPSERELARMIGYVHDNPLRTRVPIVTRSIEYEWGSARSYAGLSRADFPNVARALELLGREAWRVKPAAIPLADLAPARVPCASPELILGATAQTYMVDPAELAASGRAPSLSKARAVYAFVGRLESYHCEQLAVPIGKTRQRLSQLASGEVDEPGARVVRTLIRTRELRARLRPARVMVPAS